MPQKKGPRCQYAAPPPRIIECQRPCCPLFISLFFLFSFSFAWGSHHPFLPTTYRSTHFHWISLPLVNLGRTCMSMIPSTQFDGCTNSLKGKKQGTQTVNFKAWNPKSRRGNMALGRTSHRFSTRRGVPCRETSQRLSLPLYSYDIRCHRSPNLPPTAPATHAYGHSDLDIWPGVPPQNRLVSFRNEERKIHPMSITPVITV